MQFFMAGMIVLFIGADQLTKYWAEQSLSSMGSMPVLGDLLTFQYSQNTGAAFGILKDQQWIFMAVTIVMSLFFMYLLFFDKVGRPLMRWALMLICAGGIGNLIDRIAHGYVTDFIYLKFINFPIFNIADICVVVGAILFIAGVLFFKPKESVKPVGRRVPHHRVPPRER
ncbi:MAG: signal peptidase II [Clostridiales bacterium]|nr:signal peptidase II [Clostridiales bacterium]